MVANVCCIFIYIWFIKLIYFNIVKHTIKKREDISFNFKEPLRKCYKSSSGAQSQFWHHLVAIIQVAKMKQLLIKPVL